ncbi:MAG: 2-C-methyl-D-erythritol 4-phosphate cytidylyltransferase [Elusimicrobia bacterium]|nr:2-C-methyl-D-erythritol 4-phosphate cytidylyltransferase [Elusimicrobiota bacterium]
MAKKSDKKPPSRQTARPPATALILAGGTGSRMGADKQYLNLLSKPMIEWTVSAFEDSGLFSEIVLVLSPENIKKHGDWWKSRGVKLAPSGPNRTASLKSGFKKVSASSAVVAVHDGARPLVSRKVIAGCLSRALKTGAAVPGVALKDTVKKLSKDGKTFEATLERAAYMAVQTPQCYRRALLARALKASRPQRDYTDDSQLLEILGVKPAAVVSEYSNLKVTTPEDLIVAEALMNAKEAVKKTQPRARFGFGYDIHRLAGGRPLIMGGIKLDYPKGLLGHSDGDVVLHAVCDALLGSIAAGEIGVYFPPTDLTIMGISSVNIAEKTLEIMQAKKAEIVNLDVTIVAEEPKMKPYYDQIRKSLAKIFKIEIESVSVKAKSREGLGEVGRGEAIVCYAVASVVK